jgi:hypothetical protein
MLAAMESAVVDDPEHALGPGVGSAVMTCSASRRNGSIPGGRCGASEYSCALDVIGGQVGRRPAPVVFVRDALACDLPAGVSPSSADPLSASAFAGSTACANGTGRAGWYHRGR